MNDSRLEKLIGEYGPDFVKKIPLYRTAFLGNKYVKIVKVNVFTWAALVEDQWGNKINCSILDLSDFVL